MTIMILSPLSHRMSFECMQLFNYVDSDKSGYISLDEATEMYQNLTGNQTIKPDDMRVMVACCDTNKDGKLSYDGI